jgi:hypothetical protein
MSWAKLDDKFYTHPQVARMDHRMLPAVGLYCMALTWCADQLTDGFIPEHQVERLTGSVRRLKVTVELLVEALVEAGLWEVVEGGYQIHDYLAYNLDREAVLAERESARTRMKAVRSGDVHKKFARTSGEQPAKLDGSSSAPIPGVLTEHRGEGADAPCGAGSPAPMSRRKAYALNFFEQHTWLCCGLPTDEEHALREGLTSGTIGRAEVESWQ